MLTNRGNKLIVILGPTACGKTDLSIKLARKLNGAIVSADSRQVYRKMDIGTGKVTKKEMGSIPHYLLDVASPRRFFSVGQYQKKALAAIDQIIRQKRQPFLVGGSPFYLYSVIEGWIFSEIKSLRGPRQKLEKQSPEQLFSLLKKLDLRRAREIDRYNKRRLIRAIEIAQVKGRVPKLQKEPRYQCLILGIKKESNEIKAAIKMRLSRRIKQGMIEEVTNLKKSGVSLAKLEAFGLEYKWIARYLQNKTTYPEMVSCLERDIYQFSKRQMTWFKKDQRIIWLPLSKKPRLQTALKYCRAFLAHKLRY